MGPDKEPLGRQSRRLVMTALFAAFVCAATMVLVVPTPTGGYVNLGDAAVLTGAVLLGPVCGAAAGGIGGALADLLTGYAVYAPATLVIKALMAGLAGWLWRSLGKRRPNGGLVLCGLAAESVMTAGYWLYDGFLLGSLTGAAAGLPANLVQALFGGVSSALLLAALRRVPYVRRVFPQL